MVGEGEGSFSGISWENSRNANNTVALPGGWSHDVGGRRSGLGTRSYLGSSCTAVGRTDSETVSKQVSKPPLSLSLSTAPSCVTFKMLPDLSGPQSFICYAMVFEQLQQMCPVRNK